MLVCLHPSAHGTPLQSNRIRSRRRGRVLLRAGRGARLIHFPPLSHRALPSERRWEPVLRRLEELCLAGDKTVGVPARGSATRQGAQPNQGGDANDNKTHNFVCRALLHFD
jgi:hypothetical protein